MIGLTYAADAAQPGGLMSFAPLALILVVFYFLILRPQQKKFKAHQAMLAELKTGDKVILASGFTGKITKNSSLSKSRATSKSKWNAMPWRLKEPMHKPSED